MQDAGWYYAMGGERNGPVPFDQLRHLIASGLVARADLVWREGMADWQPANTIPALMPPPPVQPVYGTPIAPPPPQYAGYSATPVGYESMSNSGPSHQGMAIAGFVLSLIPFVLCTILGLIFSLVALNKMKTTANQAGKGLAIAGLIISLCFLGLQVLWIIGVSACLRF